jgi:hypothetical protein
VKHVWAGFDFKYMGVSAMPNDLIQPLNNLPNFRVSLQLEDSLLRLAAARLQDRFVENCQALWSYWQTRNRQKIPAAKIVVIFERCVFFFSGNALAFAVGTRIEGGQPTSQIGSFEQMAGRRFLLGAGRG